MPHLPLDVWVSIQPIHHSASDVTFVMVGQTPKAGLKNITVMISSRWAKKCSKRLLGVPGGSTLGPRTIFFSDNHNLNTTSTPPNQIIRYQTCRSSLDQSPPSSRYNRHLSLSTRSSPRNMASSVATAPHLLPVLPAPALGTPTRPTRPLLSVAPEVPAAVVVVFSVGPLATVPPTRWIPASSLPVRGS